MWIFIALVILGVILFIFISQTAPNYNEKDRSAIYIATSTPAPTPIVEDKKTKKDNQDKEPTLYTHQIISPLEGGTLKLSLPDGSIVKLEIPPYALYGALPLGEEVDEIEVTLQAIPMNDLKVLPEPFVPLGDYALDIKFGKKRMYSVPAHLVLTFVYTNQQLQKFMVTEDELKSREKHTVGVMAFIYNNDRAMYEGFGSTQEVITETNEIKIVIDSLSAIHPILPSPIVVVLTPRIIEIR